MKLINVTDLSSYLYCPRKLYLKRVKGFKEKATKKMILGFLKHKVFENFSNNEEKIISSIKQEISKKDISRVYEKNLDKEVEAVSNKYEKMIKSFNIMKKDLSKAVLEFMKKEIELRIDAIKKGMEKGFLGRELWDNLKPKYRTEYKILSKDLGLKGKIDRVEFGDKIIPYEIKTKNKVYFSDKIQLAAYVLLLENKFNININKGIIESKKGRQELEVDKELKDKVIDIANKIRDLDQLPKIQSNFNKCRHCKLKQDCFDLN